MLKTLGRSVYLTQFEEQRASLSAFAAGGAPVFISLHISEEFDAAYCARVQEMCDFLSAQGWRILADVSEKTIRQFGCADLTALAKRLHLWGLRLDYGFSLEEMCALAQQLPVAVNASTTTPEVARQLAAGGGDPPPPKDQGFLNNANRFRVSRVLSISRMARAMDETVNIPLLSWCVTRRRSSDTAAS